MIRDATALNSVIILIDYAIYRPFYPRPVLALVINFLIIIAGLQAIRSVNVRQFPAAKTRQSRSKPCISAQALSWCALHHHAA